MTGPPLDTRIEDLLRTLAPQVLAVLVRKYGQFDACEDATQEALLEAALQWPSGMPENPRGVAAFSRVPAPDRYLAKRQCATGQGRPRCGHGAAVHGIARFRLRD
ncbi:hypothetical protein AAHB33_17260 [Paenarthrobacter sp. S56]|uniref:hypothetical protein n=1 Tax=Paenarthrobacter sp. S56 TaxID=3138179 RepID=UPI00321AD3F6